MKNLKKEKDYFEYFRHSNIRQFSNERKNRINNVLKEFFEIIKNGIKISRNFYSQRIELHEKLQSLLKAFFTYNPTHNSYRISMKKVCESLYKSYIYNKIRNQNKIVGWNILKRIQNNYRQRFFKLILSEYYNLALLKLKDLENEYFQTPLKTSRRENQLIDWIVYLFSRAVGRPLNREYVSIIIFYSRVKNPEKYLQNFADGQSSIGITSLYFIKSCCEDLSQKTLKSEYGLEINKENLIKFNTLIWKRIISYIQYLVDIRYSKTKKAYKSSTKTGVLDGDLLDLTLYIYRLLRETDDYKKIKISDIHRQLDSALKYGGFLSIETITEIQERVIKPLKQCALKKIIENKLSDYIEYALSSNYRQKIVGVLTHSSLEYIFIKYLTQRYNNIKCDYEHRINLERRFRSDLWIERNFIFKTKIEEKQNIIKFSENINEINIDFTQTLNERYIIDKLNRNYHGKNSYLIIVVYGLNSYVNIDVLMRTIKNTSIKYNNHIKLLQLLESKASFSTFIGLKGTLLNELKQIDRLALEALNDDKAFEELRIKSMEYSNIIIDLL